jgi:FkbM family methyltransferase
MKSLRALLGAIRFLTQHPAYKKDTVGSWLRVVNWYLCVTFGIPPLRPLPRWNLDVGLPCQYKTPAKVFYVFGDDYDENLLELPKLLKSGDTFVDVGANFGIYSLLGARIVGANGKVFAFEPIPKLCALLRSNAQHNDLSALTVNEMALGETSGMASLSLHADEGRSSLRPMDGEVVGTIDVRIATLDQEISPDLTVSVVKLDVEGFELAVLKGATRILSRDRPVILFENNPDALLEAGASTASLVSELRSFGYQIYELLEEAFVPAEPKEFGNFAAIHESDSRLPNLSVIRQGGFPTVA